LLAILSTAGLNLAFEFGVRTTFFAFGALFASAGNMIPKIPFFSRWWQINRAVYTRASRFSGWALTIAGISICLLAVFAPLESFRRSVTVVLGSSSRCGYATQGPTLAFEWLRWEPFSRLAI
jgi:uncharacterized membrane protein